MTKIITFYNNKGGVSKTTTLFNLAVYLTQKDNKRILIADCDPQCNATELFFASNESAQDPDSELPGTSIYEALRPRFSGEVRQIDPKTITLTESSLYKNLWLLKGDLEFSLAENYLARAAIEAITEDIHQKNTYVAVYQLLHGLGDTHSFDYILCDVGPSTGAITRAVVLACDGYFLPLTPDRFCNQAVRVLGRVLNEWIRKHSDISKAFSPYKLKSFPGKPRLLGAVMQNFKIHSAAKAKESYIKWQDQIKETIESTLLAESNVPVSETLSPKQPFVANIRDVGTLAPVAQMFGRAIFDVRRQDTSEASTTGEPYGGVVWQGWQKRMKEYQKEIKHMAEALP
ncbi:ParA family protein [Corallococcus sp. RDP092CA]|uniref:ParA family protein n=1 Tax=Corallococcus sp. RDP092CA TaxID=3109369 RepID=UPI0035B46A12